MPRRTYRAAIPFLLVALLVAACGGDDAAETSGTNDAEPVEPVATTIEPVMTDASTTTTSTTSTTGTTTSTSGAADPGDEAADEAGWVTHRAEKPCQCADGSEYVFHTLERDPDKVLLYYQGGGACFSAETCSFSGGTYKATTGDDDHPDGTSGGIWDADNPLNPFADWTVVFMPYCSGDVFAGDTSTTYGDDLVVEHRGMVNSRHGLAYVADNHGGAAQLVVAGSSAGGIPSPLIAGLASDLLVDTEIAVLSDGSGGYPSSPPLNNALGAVWNISASIPDWPELAGLDPALFGAPDMFTHSGQHDPTIRFARFDNAYDEVQETFSSLLGLEGGVRTVLDLNEQNIEAGGVDLDVYVAPGDDHTILGSDELYELEVEGVALIDWLQTFVDGDDPGDVRCTDCGRPPS